MNQYGMRISDNQLVIKKGGGGTRFLCTTSFAQRTDLNVFQRCAKSQLIKRNVSGTKGLF